METSGIDQRRRELLNSLRFARGEYLHNRASQLSGIPGSTLYEWARNRVYVPDFANDGPMAWSYRDLVYLRLLAWLRQVGMDRSVASAQVTRLKLEFSSGEVAWRLFADRNHLIADDERTSRTNGQNILPFEDLSDLFRNFNIEEPIRELRSNPKGVWGPDLVTPSEFTTIVPSVMAGDPCVVETRIPTATIFALRIERGLSSEQVVELYPDLSIASANDAYSLEVKLRGSDRTDAFAA